MTPDAAKATLARLLATGDSVFLQRGFEPGPVTRSDKAVRVRFTSFAGTDLAGSTREGDLRVIVSADDVAAAGFPPLDANDRIDLNGQFFVIQFVDTTTRRIAGVLIGYELRVTG